MTVRVVFRRVARGEFDAAALWYEDRRTGLGAQFVSEVDHAVVLAVFHARREPKVWRGRA